MNIRTISANVVQSDEPLPSKVPGQVVSSGKFPALDKKGTIWIHKPDLSSEGAHVYWRKGHQGEVTPPPPPPPPVDTLAILSGGSAFLQNDRLSVGINEAGNLVAKSAPPAGIRYASEMGAKTVGLCLVQPDGSLFDYINDAGTRFDQFMVSRGSKDWTNARHLGLVEIAGGKLSVADGAALYEAKTPDGIPLSIRYTLDGASLIMAFTLGAPANLLYSTDPDLLDYPTEAGSDYGITTNTPMHNAIEAVRGNRKLRIEGVGGEPVIGSGRIYDDAALKLATAAVKSDQSIGLLFKAVTSATVRVSVG